MNQSVLSKLACSLLMLPLSLVGCDRVPPPEASLKMEGVVAKEPSEYAAGAIVGAPVSASEVNVAPRHLEIRHELVLEVPASDIERLWLAQRDACKLPACQLISADFSEPDMDTDSATVSMLIAASQADRLIDSLRQHGRITRHDISQVDRTLQVVDLAARLANQRALRDRLRSLSSQRADKLRDVLDLERELARVQGEIDSLDGQLRQVENVTRNVTLTLQFTKQATAALENTWLPLQNAGAMVGMTFTRSVANLLLFAASVLPWVLAALPFAWLIVRRWRRRPSAQATERWPHRSAGNDIKTDS